MAPARMAQIRRDVVLEKTHRGRAEIFALPSWHDCRCKSDPNASEEPGGEPLYEPIVDYCIDSRLGPGYSSA